MLNPLIGALSLSLPMYIDIFVIITINYYYCYYFIIITTTIITIIVIICYHNVLLLLYDTKMKKLKQRGGKYRPTVFTKVHGLRLLGRPGPAA